MERKFLNKLDNELKKERDEAGDLLLDKSPPEWEHHRDIRDYISARYDETCMIGITITYKPTYQNTMTQQQLRELLDTSLKYRIPFNRYVLIPDCDDRGNYHYHGIIDLSVKERHNFKIFMTKNIGFIKYSYITQLGGWIAYMLKNKPTQKPIYTPQEISQLYIEHTDYYKRTHIDEYY